MKLLFLLPFFDEDRNSFSKLLVPILEELLRRQVSFEIYSGNKHYSGRFADYHQAKFLSAPRLEFVVFPFNLLLGTLASWLWRRKNPQGLIHNIGGGNSFYHDVVTAHACHAQYIKVKKQYGETARIWLNPIHAMILFTEWVNYRRKPKVIAVSEFVHEGLLHHYPSLKGCIMTIENAADPSRTAPEPAGAANFNILFASNNHHHKGLKHLVEVMERAQQLGLSWKLWVAGHDPFDRAWKNLVADKGLKDSIVFLGHQSNLGQWMADSDIFCLPSKYESFGMVFLEAAQLGRPIYGSRTGILETLYRRVKGPPLCEHPVRSDDLLQGLRYWADHPEERKELGRLLQREAEKFQPAAMVQQTMALYDRLLNLCLTRA